MPYPWSAQDPAADTCSSPSQPRQFAREGPEKSPQAPDGLLWVWWPPCSRHGPHDPAPTARLTLASTASPRLTTKRPDQSAQLRHPAGARCRVGGQHRARTARDLPPAPRADPDPQRQRRTRPQGRRPPAGARPGCVGRRIAIGWQPCPELQRHFNVASRSRPYPIGVGRTGKMERG